MNKRYCIVIFFLICRFCNGQNLVPNGDFEQYKGCPTNYAQLDSLLFWVNITDSVFYYGSPDYFNQCSGTSNVGVPTSIFGYQQGHSGLGYSGAILKYITGVMNYREYLEVPLSSTLITGNCYYFEMYLSVSENSGYTTDDIGVYFSDTLISHVNNYFPLAFIPQISNTTGNYPDTLNWTLVSGNYAAAGGENFLLIGNFLNDSNTNTIPVNSNAPYNAAYVFIDDVSLILTTCDGIEEQNLNDEINIYPVPVSDKLNIAINNEKPSEIILYDISGRKLIQQDFTKRVAINTEHLAKGIYLYELRNKNGVIKKGRIAKD